MSKLKMLMVPLLLLLPLSLKAEFEVYGYVPGHKTPQRINEQQIESIKTLTHGNVATWLAIATELDTKKPKLHLIDTEHFKNFPTDYGIHQAYAQQMGIVSGASDFIAKLKSDGRRRSIMPFTLYVSNAPLSANGKSAGWVLQNRRYIFKDDSKSFAATLIQSQALFQKNLPFLVAGDPFFIAFEKEDSHHRPNTKTREGLNDIKALRQGGFEVITEPEMAAQAGVVAAGVQIHNSNGRNEAFGYLKVVRSEADAAALTPRDIAIFPTLPDRIPPVAAILTLEEQTELSHINVLAINRGTLNVAVSESAADIVAAVLKNAQQIGDKPARLAVQGGAISIGPADEVSVVKFQDEVKAKIGVVEIPAAVLNGDLGVRKASAQDSAATIGAKASNYGRIERLLGQELVEPGFALGFDLYRAIVEEGGEQSIQQRLIEPMLQKMALGQLSPQEVNAELLKIRQAIALAKLPSQTVSALQGLAKGDYKNIKDDEKVRFRSSTNCEDLPRFNGAGLYLSEGIKIKHLREAPQNPKSLKKLHEDLLLVMGSLWLDHAFWEREYFSIDHRKAAMAIQINPSFGNEAANGVIVASRKNGKTDFWINTQFGEASVTNPLPGEVPESIRLSAAGISREELLASVATLQSPSSIQPIFWGADTIDSTKAEQFVQLLISTSRVLDEFVEDQANFGIDIEFKLMSENGSPKLYLKQARPLNLSVSH